MKRAYATSFPDCNGCRGASFRLQQRHGGAHAFGMNSATSPDHRLGLALPGGRQVSGEVHGVLREGCSVPLTKLGGSARPPGGRWSPPGLQPPKTATMLKNDCARLIHQCPHEPVLKGRPYPPHPSKWAQHCNRFCFDGRSAGGSLQCKNTLPGRVHFKNGKRRDWLRQRQGETSVLRARNLGNVCGWERCPLCKGRDGNEYEDSAC